MMRVWVVRHGQSSANLEERWTGQLDVPLTERGREEAVRAGENLKNVSFDRIYASDLIRARTTAELAIPGCSYEIDSALREVDIGTFTGISYSKLTQEDREITARDGYGAFGGESKEQFRDRISGFVKNLEKQDLKNVAVFTHAGVLQKIFEVMIGQPFPRSLLLRRNCATAIFEYREGTWRLHSWINLLT